MMKKLLLIALLIALVTFGTTAIKYIFLSGSEEQETEISLNSEGIDMFNKELNDNEGMNAREDVCSLDSQRIYQVFISDDRCICLKYTTDAGETWAETTVAGEVSADGRVFVSFVDENTGYILYCSDPGLGQMEKILYITRDTGKTFSVQEDISSIISGYPTDMLYISEVLGYITVSYHGVDEYVYRYDEQNGWNSIEVQIPIEDYSYINGIDIEKAEEGFLLDLEAVTLDGRVSFSYISSDGLNWMPAQP